MRRDLLAKLAHDVRSPLNAISGFAQLLADGKAGPVSARQAEFLGDILASSQQLLQMQHDLLDWVGLETGGLELAREPINVPALLREICQSLAELAAHKQIELAIDVAPSCAALELDRARLRELVHRFVSSALELGDEGARVQIRVWPESEHALRIEVEDSSSSASADELERLFGELHSLECRSHGEPRSARRGLLWARQIAAAYGGSAGASAAPGKGCCFFAVLPRSAAASAATAVGLPQQQAQRLAAIALQAEQLASSRGALEPAARAAAEGSAAAASGGAILLVEDNPTTRRLFRAALEAAGHAVLEARDGRAALESIAERVPALIVIDVVLPDIDGLELARRLRRELGERLVPIVCMSGLLSKLHEARAGELAQVLIKPVDPAHLVEIVRVHLGAPAAAASGHGGGRLLLVVDDDPLQRKLAQIWFSQAGFEVRLASDGAAALELARRERPSAVVSDVLMPGLDGFALCYALRQDPALAGVPVVLTSAAYVEDDDHALAQRVGASALLPRRADLEALTRAVFEALGAGPGTAQSAPPDWFAQEHGRRALWQLERQTRRNAQLLERAALQGAQLAVLAAVAEALAESQALDRVLGELLGACLDMAGIPKGALYLATETGRLQLQHQIGCSPAQRQHLADAAVCERIGALARGGKIALVPSDEVPAESAELLLAEAGLNSLLLVPVVWGSTPIGALLLSAGAAELLSEDALAFARVLGAQIGQAIKLAQSFSRLGASEQRYRALMDYASDAISILTPEGVVREANRKLASILGYRAEELIGRHIREFAGPGIDDENARALMAAGGSRSAPVALRKADGGVALLEFSTIATQVGGEPLVLSIGRDVTEQLRAQAQLMVADRMASIGTLSAGVAHEINNPLAAVLANLDFAAKDAGLLARELGGSPRLAELQESLQNAREGAERVRNIVRDLKIFSRAEENRSGSVDVQRVMESTLRIAWNEIRYRARLVKDYSRVPPVEANESRLGQVFLNLLVNAAQALPEGQADTHEIRIATRCDPAGRVLIEIRDSGPGIPPETLRRLFTPFFTTKPAGVGTGLGLAICQRIVSELGGEIEVESQLGVGSTFRVILPASQSRPLARPAGPLAAPAARRGRVLLVDDDPLVGSAVRRTLGGEHELVLAGSVEQALARIAAEPPFDVILCDIIMPVLTGMDFHERVREMHPELLERIVFVTGGAFSVRTREFLDQVPNALVEKPFESETLRALVNRRIR